MDASLNSVVSREKLWHSWNIIKVHPCFWQDLSHLNCMNILLGFVELLSFQQYLSSEMNDNNIAVYAPKYSRGSLFKSIGSTDTIPETLIVAEAKLANGQEMIIKEEDLLITGKETCYDLFHKYIEYGSRYQVNLRADTRQKYIRLMMDKNNWMQNDLVSLRDILFLFDAAVHECYVLILDSCLRFEKAPIYHERVKHFV